MIPASYGQTAMQPLEFALCGHSLGLGGALGQTK